MRLTGSRVCLFLLTLCSPTTAEAEPFTVLPDGSLVFNTILSTQGVLTCRGAVPCSGQGTHSVTFGGGDQRATITFTGVTDLSIQVGNSPIAVSLGVFETWATPGFIFPERPNPYWPLLQFDLLVDHASPVTDRKRKVWLSDAGGRPDLRLFTIDYFSVPTGPNPPGFDYPALVYTVPVSLVLSSGHSTDLIAQVGAVPEPATLVLLGTGLCGAAWSRRRSRIIS